MTTSKVKKIFQSQISLMISVLLGFGLFQYSQAQTFLKGRITYGDSKPLPGCNVSLISTPAITPSSADGTFEIQLTSIKKRIFVGSDIIFKGNILSINTFQKKTILISLVNLLGKVVATKTFLSNGSGEFNYNIENLFIKKMNSVYILRVKVGSASKEFKIYDQKKWSIKNSSETTNTLFKKKAKAPLDSLQVSCTGFPTKKIEISSYNQDIGDVTVNSPNFIFILADDMGYGEVSTFRRQFVKNNTTVYFDTPELDRMASSGLIFTDFYAGNTVCAPSRANLMSGKHPGHASIRGNNGMNPNTNTWERIGLNPQIDSTIAQVLKKANYKTAIFGKWHLQSADADPNTFPNSMGFDVVLRERWDPPDRFYYQSDYIQNYPYKLFYQDTSLASEMEQIIQENQNTQRGYYLDDINTDYGKAFIKSNQDNSFFLFLSYKTPHSPQELNDISQFDNQTWPNVEKIHAGRIQQIDKRIGDVINYLDTLGIASHTLVIFTSDNGPHNVGSHNHNFFDSNGDLRGFKRDLYEGGVRVPTIAYWKGVIGPGQVTDHQAAFWDIMATAADLAGVNTPANTDGISFLPKMKGLPQSTHDYLYWEFYHRADDYKKAVRLGDWKGVKINTSAIQLFDLKTDISESNNVAGSNTGVVDQIRDIMNTARSSHPWYQDI